MKLRYFISFFALIALLSSCSDEETMTLLDELKVSSSYVGIDVNGGSNNIILNANGAWTFDQDEIPEWLTVSPMSGGAGEYGITFTAPAAPDGRTAVLHVECNGKQQTINVIQGLAVVSEATCAEVNAGPESKTYRVTGTVDRIINTTYGNWYLRDETGEVYVYGTLDAKGNEKNFMSLGLEVGDIVTIEGPKSVYNGTVELVNVTVVKIQKSLVKVEGYDPEDATIPVEGGNVTVNLSCKTNNGISVEIPDEAKDWLGIVSVSGGAEPTVTFHANANPGGDRSASVVFKTTDDKGQEYTASATINQKGAIVAATVAEFLEAPVGDTQYRLNGIVVGLYRENQGFYLRDYTGETLIYRPEGFTGTEVKVGDVVTVVGKRGAYKDSPQMVSGMIEEINYTAKAISIAEFRNLPDDKEAYYLISGEIVTATEEGSKNDIEQYGNFNLKDETGEVYIYGVYTGWGGQKGHFGELGLTWGDKITIIAYKTTYKGLVEGVGYYISREE